MVTRLTANAITAQVIHALVYKLWPIPPGLQKRLARALHKAPCHRACTLRQYLALVGCLDLDAFFTNVASPSFMMELIDSFVDMGIFSRKEGSALQEAVLSGVQRDGSWMPKDMRRQHGCVAYAGVSLTRHTP